MRFDLLLGFTARAYRQGLLLGLTARAYAKCLETLRNYVGYAIT